MSKNKQKFVLDVGEDYKDKKRIVEEEINYQNIQDYENNYNYKVSYINIDSRFRTSVPQNVVDNMLNYLPLNPITTFKDEYRVKVNIGTHSFKIGDKIILQNITAKNVILSNPIYLISDYNYFMVYMTNHNILPLYTKSDDYKINISLYEEALITDRIIGNIPLNSLLGNHNINVYNNDELFLPDPVRNRILTELNLSTTELIQNYFFIKLPFNYININIINNDTVFDLFQNIKKIFRFQFNNIGCINLYYLNANYPINNTQYQALHEITNVGEAYIEFNSSSIAYHDETNGGDGVVIGLVLNTIEGYPDANNYTISLKKTLTDVISIGLVSSEFPYVKYNLQNNITVRPFLNYYDLKFKGSGTATAAAGSARASAEIIGSEDDNGIDAGLGIDYIINNQSKIGLSYSQFIDKFSDTDSTKTYSISFNYQF